MRLSPSDFPEHVCCSGRTPCDATWLPGQVGRKDAPGTKNTRITRSPAPRILPKPKPKPRSPEKVPHLTPRARGPKLHRSFRHSTHASATQRLVLILIQPAGPAKRGSQCVRLFLPRALCRAVTSLPWIFRGVVSNFVVPYADGHPRESKDEHPWC